MMSAGTRFRQDGKARKLRGLMQSRAAEWHDLPPDRSPRPAVASTPASSRWSRDESPRRPHRHVADVLCSLSAAREHGPPLTAGGVVTRDEKRLRNYRAPKLLLAVRHCRHHWSRYRVHVHVGGSDLSAGAPPSPAQS
jgi:hypothetical protein